MKRNLKFWLVLLVAIALGAASCKALRGDPRKNCNHPDHGKYMMQKRMQKSGY